MHPLNFYDDGDERKKNFHSWKEKEGVLLHHFHALNRVLLYFPFYFLEPCKKLTNILSHYREGFAEITLLFKTSLFIFHVSPLMCTPHFGIERL